MRSAESCIGVSGFLISCARRRATSPQAAWRCACRQLRDFVEHQHEPQRARIARQRGAGTDELASAGVGAQRDLLAPLGLAGLHVPLQHFVERCQERLPGRDLRQRLAGGIREVDAEDAARGLVCDADAQVRLERDDAAREPGEDHRERRALGLDRGAASLGFLARARKLLRHVVEGRDEVADLVVRRALDARIEVTLGDCARAGDQVLDRAHQPLGEI